MVYSVPTGLTILGKPEVLRIHGTQQFGSWGGGAGDEKVVQFSFWTPP